MALWIAGAADAEISHGRQLCRQVTGVAVILFHMTVRRDIPPERQDVFYPVFPEPFHHAHHMLPGGGNTGQMGHGRDSVFFRQAGCQVRRILAGAAAGPIGDAHKRRGKPGDLHRRLLHDLICALFFGREHFKGKNWFFLG